jgi:hypothetical protein
MKSVLFVKLLLVILRLLLCICFLKLISIAQQARISLQMKVTEGSAVQLVKQTCDHLVR